MDGSNGKFISALPRGVRVNVVAAGSARSVESFLGAKTDAVTVISTVTSVFEFELASDPFDMVVLCRDKHEPASLRGFFELFRNLNKPFWLYDGKYFRPSRITDLFEDKLAPDASGVDGKTVMVTGGAGSVGSALVKASLMLGAKKVVALDRSEYGLFKLSELNEKHRERLVRSVCDVTDERGLEAAFLRHRPEVVFHAAAYKHLPMMEDFPAEAVKNNVFGTEAAIKAAKSCGAERFVFVSTDKAVDPISVMGATKRVAETLTLSGGENFSAVRFGNVLASSGSVVEIFEDKLSLGESLPLTSVEAERFFMTVEDAANLLISVAAKKGGLYALDMGEPIKILSLAEDVAALRGYDAKEIGVAPIGFRGGEKTTEKLTADGETVVPCGNGVFGITGSPVADEKFFSALQTLKAAAEINDDETVRRLLKEL